MNSGAEPVPDVSVIIPVYGRAAMLPKAVASALAANGPIGVEVIVVDDGSPEPVADALHAMPARVLRLPSNAGASAARNAGLRLAHGRYLKFLDSDDVLHAASLAAEVAHADATGADIVVSGWRVVIDRAGMPETGARYPAPVFTSIPDDLLAGKGVPTSAALYRRASVDGIAWRYAGAMDDWDYFVRCAVSARIIASCGTTAYDWIQHDQTRITTSATVRQQVDAFYLIVGTLIERLEHEGLMYADRKRLAAQFLYKELRRLYVLDRSEGRRVLRWIRALDPDFVPVLEEPSRLFRLAGRLGALRPALECYALAKRILS